MRWVILGCGYTGERLAADRLAAGDAVLATARSAERVAELRDRLPGAVVASFDRGAPTGLPDVAGAVVVDSIPPGPAGPEGERATARRAASAGARRLVYLSSTGVYGRGGEGWIDEDTPPAPLADRGRRRLAAETAILESAAAAGLEAVALRIAGIYGPGRGVVARLRRGDYRLIGDGTAAVSRVHVTDLVAAIVRAGTVDPLPRSIYCVADDQPVSSREHALGVAALLGCDPPPSVPASAVGPEVVAMLGADRRISNRRIKRELGLELRYPSWREGAAALIAAGD